MDSQNSTINPAQGLDAVASFLREYLLCNEHQLTALTLWVAHTWCLSGLLDVAYLAISSPQPQSGKSVCLRLLDMLCCESSLVTAAAPNALKHRLLYGRSVTQINKNVNDPNHEKRPRIACTFLIDDYQHSFGPSDRQALVAILNCGLDLVSRYSNDDDDYVVTCPKAFAGNTPLPSSLASRCIPIILRRAKFSEPLKRFSPDDFQPLTDTLKQWLQSWAEEAAPRLLEGRTKSVNFPPALTPHQQQCAEPLLRVANLIGGSWPAKARAALAALFNIAECNDQVQLLRDIRTLFLQNNRPEEMPTRDLLSFLRSLENRPWSAWGDKSGQKLASLLHSLEISSHDIRVGEAHMKGYYSRDFQDAWERYAGPVTALAVTEKTP